MQNTSAKMIPRMFGLRATARAIRIMVQREWLKVMKEPSRALGIMIQPLLFWGVIGSGFVPSFKSEQMADVGYQTYFFPGVLALVLLFSSIFSMITLIDDRSSGFLQAVLVSPASRTAVVLGKVSGTLTIASVQMFLFLPLLPLAGISFTSVSWGFFLAFASLGALFFTSLGFVMAWLSPSTSAFHAIMSIFLIPMWILSGAMFPLENTWMAFLATVNPAAWLVKGFQFSLFGAHLNDVSLLPLMLKLGVFAVLILSIGVLACHRNR